MKKLQIIKMTVIAAGFIISAAFYVLMGEGAGLLQGLSASEQVDTRDKDTGEEPNDWELELLSGEGDSSLELSELSGLSSLQREEVSSIVENEIGKLRDELSAMLREDSTEPGGSGAEAEPAPANSKGREPQEASGAQEAPGVQEASEGQSRKVNINTASMEELMELKGIGEARARAIIEYRETYGGFGYIEEIMNVSGIKEAAFGKIKDQLCI